LTLCAAAVCGAGCARSSQASDQAPRIEAGPLFEQACAKCHGADGSGGLPTVANGPKPVNFRDAAWQASRSDDEIAAAIRDGRGAMPPFADVLKPEQIGELMRHVRAMK
jgi:mono/diheme cytochrome c family protein